MTGPRPREKTGGNHDAEKPSRIIGMSEGGTPMSRFAVAVLLAVLSLAGIGREASADDPGSCPRPPAGSVAAPPPDLWSQNGVLNVAFNYYTTVDDTGRTLFCFITPNGLQSPTLHVHPGDRLDVRVTNNNPPAPPGSPTEVVSNSGNQCGDMTMTITSLNVHYHGTNTSPACHGDQVVHTIINSGETFQYSLTFPTNEPPGLYWYHPHVHGIAEAAVQGGASGAIIVEGIENIQPAVANLPERVLIIRDMTRTNGPPPDPSPSKQVASWDASLNYVPIAAVYPSNQLPQYTPAVIRMRAGIQEFWRVVNASADTIIDLQLQYDGVVQPLQVVALDGVPTGSQDGTRSGTLVTMSDILLAPAARAEFVVAGPPLGVTANLVTLLVDTGPGGDSDPTRPLASILTNAGDDTLSLLPEPSRTPNPQRFEGLANVQPSATRHFYFSEVLSDPTNPNSPTNFFITVDGDKPVLFDPNNPPAIVTTQGAVEDWIIENRTAENHEFHQHQIHFLLEEVNGDPVPPQQQQFLDMVQVPYYTGKGPYPSVKVRMDFRGPDIGDFVYHCHILAHEDGGMMAIIRVLPPS
jgi:FtsP/CotA-like multicopper oxidase with cupredoxin domain